jgi:flagellum-specific ATP synthase
MLRETPARARVLQLEALVQPPVRFGRVLRFDGAIAGVSGCRAASVGAACRIDTADGVGCTGEVIGFRDEETVVALTGGSGRLVAGARVRVGASVDEVAVGDDLLGRVWDADGLPLDGLPPLVPAAAVPLHRQSTNPLLRAEIHTPLDVGVRAINALLSLGRGQRIGLIAGSGVGKSMLLGMLCAGTQADVVIVGLIGERAREVSAFVESVIPAAARPRTAVVAVSADRSPILRIRGANRVAAMAEYFRAQGRHVLLLLDSLTRVGHAQREIGLALGEQPTVKGYPPSVIALVPRIVERAGSDRDSGGSITAIYTLLADGDDIHDPVVDAARAIMDGHIVLSRALAEQGVYPAIDVSASISRVMQNVADKSHTQAAQLFRRRYALYHENKDLVMMGGYEAGRNPELDIALGTYPQLMDLVSQPVDEVCGWQDSIARLKQVVGHG